MFQIFSSSAVSPSLSVSTENDLFSSGKWAKALISQTKISLGVGLALAVGSAAWVAQYNAGPRINLNLSNFEWVSEIQLSVEKAPVKTHPFWEVTEGEKLFEQIPSVAKDVASLSERRRKVLATFQHTWKRRAALALARGEHEVPITSSSAAPINAPLESLLPKEADSNELNVLRTIHFQIRQQLQAAMNPSSVIRFAKIDVNEVSTQPETTIKPAAVLVQPELPKEPIEAPAVAEVQPAQVALPEPAAVNTHLQAPVSTQVSSNVSIDKVYDQVLASSPALQAREGMPDMPRAMVEVAQAKPIEPVKLKNIEPLAMRAPPLQDWDESNQAKDSETSSDAAASVISRSDDADSLNSNGAPLVATQAGSDSGEYSNLVGYSQPSAVSKASAPVVIPSKNVVPAPLVAQPQAQESALDRAQNLVAASLYGPNPDPSILAQPMVVEAFHWETLISGSKVSQITQEGSDQNNNGWQSYRAENHWNTLIYNTPDTQIVPLLNQNTAAWLALKAGTELQTSASIIFGKIPNNWSVELSGRSENVLILDGHGFPIGNATAEERYFAFVNAEPGAHLIYLAQGSQTVAVGAVGSAGSATYLDLTRINTSGINGQVLDGSLSAPKGMSGIKVHVVGQPGTTTVTGSDGSFNLDAVLTVGNYPIYCETEGTSGFTHRYQVQPTNTQNVQFYRYGEAQVGHWIDQLEGGVSPESGLIVSGVKSLVNASVQKGLTPSAEAFVGDATLNPETYALMPDGEIRDNVLLRDGIYHYVSVQVPEGANITELEDNNGRVFWSELFFASPGVINVINH